MSEFVVGVRVDGTAAGLAKAALEEGPGQHGRRGAKDLTAIGRATNPKPRS